MKDKNKNEIILRDGVYIIDEHLYGHVSQILDGTNEIEVEVTNNDSFEYVVKNINTILVVPESLYNELVIADEVMKIKNTEMKLIEKAKKQIYNEIKNYHK